MKVEVLHTPGCPNCLRELDSLRTAALAVDPALEWHELDILQALDYAVQLGVLKAPALAIDGRLAFAALPTPARLAAALREQAIANHGR